MAVAETHPSVEELAAFILGILGDETHASVEVHVAACTSCQERAAVAPGDSLVELLRSVHARAGRGADTMSELAAQVQTPAPLAAVADRVALAPAESDRSEVPDTPPPELARHERYRVVRLLGVGGMGAVYEAEHRVMQRSVALKVIKRAYTADADARERFRREVRAAARLSHPNIVITYDAEDAGETHFLVMEYVEGTDLGRLVRERGPLPVERACDYVRQAALGLQYAFEQGMVHRDLKPHNLMRTPDGGVKILDFGLARFASEAASAAALTNTGMVLGTVDYIAPEQADNAHQADIRSDIYSLGCTLYHLLAGRPPFPTGTPLQKVMAHAEKKPQPLTELRDDLLEGIIPVLERMMAKDPKHRYQTPAEVALALEPFTRAIAVARAPKPRLPARTTDPDRTIVLEKTLVRDRRRPRFLIATGILASLVAGLLGVGVYRIATDKGELVISAESDDVEVVIKQGGKVVRIVDTKTKKAVRLDSGLYDLELKGQPDGLKLSPDKVTIRRGETLLAAVDWRPSRAVDKVGEVRRFKGHSGSVRAVAYSPDGRFVLSGSGWPKPDRTLRLWNLATGQEVWSREADPAEVLSVAFSPDGRRVVSAGTGLRVWETETGKELIKTADPGWGTFAVTFTHDGRRLLSGDGDGKLRLRDATTGELLRTFGDYQGWIYSVACSPDGRWAVATEGVEPRGRGQKLIHYWDLEIGKELWRTAGQGIVPTFDPHGRYTLSVDNNTVQLLDVKTGKVIRRFEGHTGTALGQDPVPVRREGAVSCVAFSPDGHRILSGGRDATLRLWDVETGKELSAFFGHTSHILGVAFSPSGRYAVSGSADGTVRLWRLPAPPPTKGNP